MGPTKNNNGTSGRPRFQERMKTRDGGPIGCLEKKKKKKSFFSQFFSKTRVKKAGGAPLPGRKSLGGTFRPKGGEKKNPAFRGPPRRGGPTPRSDKISGSFISPPHGFGKNLRFTPSFFRGIPRRKTKRFSAHFSLGPRVSENRGSPGRHFSWGWAGGGRFRFRQGKEI